MPQSVSRPCRDAPGRLWTLNEITLPIVPTGTIRLSPSRAKLWLLFLRLWFDAQLQSHITDCVGAYNYARRLKTLNGLTP